jgi:hypothetical protein
MNCHEFGAVATDGESRGVVDGIADWEFAALLDASSGAVVKAFELVGTTDGGRLLASGAELGNTVGPGAVVIGAVAKTVAELVSGTDADVVPEPVAIAVR